MIANIRRILSLIVGDLLVYIFSLIITLAIRYEEIPSRTLLLNHLPSFSVLFLVFILASFIAGLYDKQVAFIRKQIQGGLFRVQIINIFIGAMFFYLAPVSIAPKANLIIYFIISTLLLFLWRTIMFPVISITRKQSAILIGQSENVKDLYEEINKNDQYGLYIKGYIVPTDNIETTALAIGKAVQDNKSSIIIADLHDRFVEPTISHLYSLVFSGARVIDAGKLYESIFDRIPISIVGERWLVENSGTALGNRQTYDLLKRVIDVIVAFVGGIISLIFYPFIYLGIKLDDNGPIFIKQERIGSNGKLIQIYKFRSMSGNDNGKYNNDGKTRFEITKFGRFLRMSRLDELPQIWNVIKGDLSLVGPRPELPSLVEIYNKKISYYNARHLVKPGLFGWAQIYHEAHPHHSIATEDTKEKLSYDLYYIKNRSLILDVVIIFRTIQILMKRSGR